ncbi:MAG: hypothetical protein JXB46_07120 [Candidatus Eisenbacteria bacterium]|nr:hypothetical protein [Candidatus Eisenbacteria bacterium]
MASSGLTNAYISCLAVSDSNVFAGTSDGLFRSTNNGTNWTPVDSGLTTINIRSLAVSDGNVFVGTGGAGVFLSTNNGTSWTAANTGLPPATVECLAVSGSYMFAGTDFHGVYLPTNSGIDWTPANSGLAPNTTVLCLAVSGGDILAGTMGGGVWRRPLSEMVGVIRDRPVPGLSNGAHFRLLTQAAANSPATVVFSLPRAEDVTLTVYSLCGREAACLVGRDAGSGSHYATWDSRSIAAGYYVVRMQAASYAQAGGILLGR